MTIKCFFSYFRSSFSHLHLPFYHCYFHLLLFLDFFLNPYLLQSPCYHSTLLQLIVLSFFLNFLNYWLYNLSLIIIIFLFLLKTVQRFVSSFILLCKFSLYLFNVNYSYYLKGLLFIITILKFCLVLMFLVKKSY